MKNSKNNLLFLALAVFLLQACAKEKMRARHAEFFGKRTASAIALENLIKRNRLEVSNLRALARVLFGDSQEERETNAAIVISRPGKARVDAFDPLADVWARAGTDGSEMWLYLPAKSKLYSGSASQSNLKRLTKFDFEPAELLNILAGAPPTNDDAKLLQVPGEKDHFVAEGTDVHLWTGGKNSRVVKVARLGGSESEDDYTVSFEDFKRVDGVDFPHRIEAKIPKRGARIVVVYKDLNLPDSIDSGVFLAPKTARARLHKLDGR